MTLKDLQQFVNIVVEIANKTNYTTSLNTLRSSWNNFMSYKKAQPQNASVLQNMNNALAQAETHKKNLNEAAQKIKSELENLSNFPLSKNFDKFFGDSFVQFINSINQTTVDSEFPKLMELFTQYQQISQLSNVIKALKVPLTNIDLENNDFIEITFDGEASVKTLKDFAKESDKWSQTINLVGRIARENNTDISIESVEKGSLVLFVAAVATIVVVICKAVDKIQNVILKHIDIQKKTFELRKLQVDGFDDILKKLEQQAKTNLNKESNEISDTLMTDYGWAENDELYNETRAATKKAVKSLIAFTNKGGSIKGYLQNPDNSQKETLKIVNEKNKKIKELELNIKELSEGKQTLLIEYLPSDDGDSEEIKKQDTDIK